MVFKNYYPLKLAHVLEKKGSNVYSIQKNTGVSCAQIYKIWGAGIPGLIVKKERIVEEDHVN